MKFADALAAPGFGAIAEFKRRSPSAGDLRPDGDVAQVARAYERAGARAMCVLVDERFGGALGRPARRARGHHAAAARQGLLRRRQTISARARDGRRRCGRSCCCATSTTRAAQS